MTTNHFVTTIFTNNIYFHLNFSRILCCCLNPVNAHTCKLLVWVFFPNMRKNTHLAMISNHILRPKRKNATEKKQTKNNSLVTTFFLKKILSSFYSHLFFWSLQPSKIEQIMKTISSKDTCFGIRCAKFFISDLMWSNWNVYISSQPCRRFQGINVRK